MAIDTDDLTDKTYKAILVEAIFPDYQRKKCRPMTALDNTHIIIQKFEPLLKDLSERELVVLNKMVVERVRMMHKAKSLLHMTKFHRGDHVSWTGSDGMVRSGIIIRLNNKTASVQTGDEGYWKVSPQLLRKS